MKHCMLWELLEQHAVHKKTNDGTNTMWLTLEDCEGCLALLAGNFNLRAGEYIVEQHHNTMPKR